MPRWGQRSRQALARPSCARHTTMFSPLSTIGRILPGPRSWLAATAYHDHGFSVLMLATVAVIARGSLSEDHCGRRGGERDADSVAPMGEQDLRATTKT